MVEPTSIWSNRRCSAICSPYWSASGLQSAANLFAQFRNGFARADEYGKIVVEFRHFLRADAAQFDRVFGLLALLVLVLVVVGKGSSKVRSSPIAMPITASS